MEMRKYLFQIKNKDPELDHPNTLIDRLANWALTFGISIVALTALFSLLRFYHPDLTKDARSVLNTKTQYTILEQAGGQYYFWNSQISEQSYFQNDNVCCRWLYSPFTNQH